jgi:hypothetical protein
MKTWIHKHWCSNPKLSAICCPKMAGFLSCGGGNKKKYEDGLGSQIPEFGIVCFPWDRETDKIMELRPQWVRIGIDQGVNYSLAATVIRFFRRKGVRVMVSAQDKVNPLNTHILIDRYAHEFRDDIEYECCNEMNSEIIKGNYLEPEVYVDILRDFRRIVKSASATATVIMGGLNGEVKKNNPGREIPTVNYIREFVNAGGLELTDKWNFHIYGIDNKFYQILDLMRKLDRDKPVILGEFGTD